MLRIRTLCCHISPCKWADPHCCHRDSMNMVLPLTKNSELESSGLNHQSYSNAKAEFTPPHISLDFWCNGLENAYMRALIHFCKSNSSSGSKVPREIDKNVIRQWTKQIYFSRLPVLPRSDLNEIPQ